MVTPKDPCMEGLTPDCFEEHPEWAKMAFAYRLLCAILPPWLTRRLQKYLLKAIFGPGVVYPPGYIPPPGWVFPPGSIIPPDWEMGDPFPDVLTIPPDAVFPPGWKPWHPLPPGVFVDPSDLFPDGWTMGDPFPDGFVVDPDAVFPDGWTPDDPLPDGVTIDPEAVFPIGWIFQEEPPEDAIEPPKPPKDDPDSRIPPLYIEPWEPGPIKRPTDILPPSGPWFEDMFETFDLSVWDDRSSGEGSVTNPNGHLRFLNPFGGNLAEIKRVDSRPWPASFNLYFRLKYVAGSRTFKCDFWTGTNELQINFYPPDRIRINSTDGPGYREYNLGSYLGLWHIWNFYVVGGLCWVYRLGHLIDSAVPITIASAEPGAMYFRNATEGDILLDYFVVEAI